MSGYRKNVSRSVMSNSVRISLKIFLVKVNIPRTAVI